MCVRKLETEFPSDWSPIKNELVDLLGTIGSTIFAPHRLCKHHLNVPDIPYSKTTLTIKKIALPHPNEEMNIQSQIFVPYISTSNKFQDTPNFHIGFTQFSQSELFTYL
jgi:hypothetical protein